MSTIHTHKRDIFHTKNNSELPVFFCFLFKTNTKIPKTKKVEKLKKITNKYIEINSLLIIINNYQFI